MHMAVYGVTSFQAYIFLFLYAVLFCFIIYFLFKWIRHTYSDIIIFISRDGRFNIKYTKLKDAKKVDYADGEYKLVEDSAILNRKGKSLYVFSVGNPVPLLLRYKKAEWLSSESIKAMLNNELIQKIVNPVNSTEKVLLLIGALGGIIAGLASLIILAMELGIIGGGA